MDEFDAQLNAPPALKWEHEPNPVVGLLVSRYEYDGGEFAPAAMLVIQPEGSDVAYSILCGRATLRSFIERANPQVGGKVGIRYAGELVSKKNGKSYSDYRCAYQPLEPLPPAMASLPVLAGSEDPGDEPPF